MIFGKDVMFQTLDVGEKFLYIGEVYTKTNYSTAKKFVSGNDVFVTCYFNPKVVVKSVVKKEVFEDDEFGEL